MGVYNPFSIKDRTFDEKLVFFSTFGYIALLCIAIALLVRNGKMSLLTPIVLAGLVNIFTQWYVMYLLSCLAKSNTKGCDNLARFIGIMRVVALLVTSVIEVFVAYHTVP